LISTSYFLIPEFVKKEAVEKNLLSNVCWIEPNHDKRFKIISNNAWRSLRKFIVRNQSTDWACMVCVYVET